MTKYILHGGMTNIPNIHNKKFYLEMFHAANNQPILACYYSRPIKEWKNLLLSDKKRMRKAIGKKKFEFIAASKNPRIFLKQLDTVQAVYFRGGDTQKLEKRLATVRGQLKKYFSGKTVLGSSAGALFLSKYYFDQDYDKILKGFNILSVKIMTHYLTKEGKYADTSGKEKLEMIKHYRENLPTYAIPETEFIVLNN